MLRKKDNPNINEYLNDKEYIANKYVIKSFAITMYIYTFVLVLNLLGIFTVNQRIMISGYVLSLAIYAVMMLAALLLHPADRGGRPGGGPRQLLRGRGPYPAELLLF